MKYVTACVENDKMQKEFLYSMIENQNYISITFVIFT